MADKRRSRGLLLFEGLAEFSATQGVIAGLAATAATMVTRKALMILWTKVTGKEPPTHPEDPQVALPEALTWTMLAGVTMGTARMLAIRAAARRKRGAQDGELAGTAGD